MSNSFEIIRLFASFRGDEKTFVFEEVPIEEVIKRPSSFQVKLKDSTQKKIVKFQDVGVPSSSSEHSTCWVENDQESIVEAKKKMVNGIKRSLRAEIETARKTISKNEESLSILQDFDPTSTANRPMKF